MAKKASYLRDNDTLLAKLRLVTACSRDMRFKMHVLYKP